MVRISPSAVFLAVLLVTATAAFADPASSSAADNIQAAPASEQAASAPRSKASDAAIPMNSVPSKGIVPVGFGWG
jgi:hypothetical protein